MKAVLAAIMALAAGPALAQAGDAVDGRRLAEQWCANCHRIAAGGPGPSADAVASFPTIAARPGASADQIATFLRSPHATMPDHGLTPRQAQDLAAFILAQRPR